MTKPQSLPVEEARKKFADVLDGTQFRSTHTEITRRGKPAGYVVPPEWYASAAEALAEVKALRRKVEDLRATPSPSDPGSSQPAAVTSPRPVTVRVDTEPTESRRRPTPLYPVRPEPVEMTEARAAELVALVRERGTARDVEELDRRVSTVSEAYQDFARVAEAQGMGLLTQDEIDGHEGTSA
jgi:prevent-host-death family protein